MATEILSLCSSTIDLLRDHVLKHICYAIQVGQNVEALNDKAGMLEAKKNDVSQKIAAEERANKMPTNEVNNWIRRVADLQQEAQSIHRDYGQRNCVMFGSCSFNCFSNYSIGRRAAKELLKVEAELNYCNDKEITTELLPPPAQEMSTTFLTAGSSVASEIESKLKSALDFLRDDAEGALGVWGMGGVGKTTLLEHINNSLAKDPSFGFHHVIFLVASRDCTVEKIQKLLEKKLSLNNGREIFDHLNTKNFVLLLDDLWERLDLKKVGIPLPLGTVGQYKRKVILTTRSQQVCRNMDIRRSIRVECLSQEAARVLFREKVGLDVICSHPWIPELADRVADECDGLPLALITIGRAMSGNQTIQVWENAISLLRKSKISEIQGMDDPLPLLKFSYDHLKNPMEKECFLHCALWPEDRKIVKDELIKCWMGHGLLGDFDDMQEAYNRGHAIIDSLQKACLLEYVEAKGSIRLKNDRVKLHDIIRDMALWIARDCGANEKKWVVLARLGMQEAPQDERIWSEAQKMSLMHNELHTLPSKIQNSCKLTTLMLQRNSNLASDGMGIIKYFHTLKFLDLSSCTELKSVPIEISGLKKLEYLNLSYTGITSLPVELKNLTNLKYLIARKSRICEVPTDLVRNLVNLLELDLFTEIDDINQSSIINNLDCFEGHLKALGINVSTFSDLHKLVQLFRLPIRALGIRHMEGLTFLELLSQDVLGSQHMHSTLDTLVIQNCDSNLTELVVSEKYCLPLVSLDLNQLPGLKEVIWKGVEPKDVLSKLRRLVIFECSTLKHVSWIVNLPCLEYLDLRNCRNLQHLVWEDTVETEETYRLAFPTLRILVLHALPKLSSVCHRTLTFPSLEFLIVSDCAQLNKLPFRSPPCLSNLKHIAGERDWWESLELEDDSRVSLQPFFMPLEE